MHGMHIFVPVDADVKSGGFHGEKQFAPQLHVLSMGFHVSHPIPPHVSGHTSPLQQSHSVELPSPMTSKYSKRARMGHTCCMSTMHFRGTTGMIRLSNK